MIVAEHGEKQMTEEELAFGPYILANGHPLHKDMLILKRADLRQLLSSLSDEDTEELLKRKKQLNEEIEKIGEVIERL